MKRSFGKYTINRELGQGGMASVFEATHNDLGRKVALKIMHPHLAGDENFRKRFDMEARAVAQLEHIHLVQIYDYGAFEDQYYIAMELVEGDDLETIIKKQGALPAEICAIIFSEIASGLHQAHAQKIIHRDIKLSNIIIKNNGISKLTDFGIIRIEGERNITESGSIIGTPCYLAPEQLSDSDPTARLDIYALGISMYFALTERFPFKLTAIPAVFDLIAKGNRIPLQETETYVPRELALVVEKCIEKDPGKRYETAEQVAGDLEAFLYKGHVRNDKSEVKKYLDDPVNYSQALKSRTLETKIKRAGNLEQQGMIFEAIQEYEGILCLNPDDHTVQARLRELGNSVPKAHTTDIHKRPPRKKLKIAVFVIILLVAGLLLGRIYIDSDPDPEPYSISAPVPGVMAPVERPDSLEKQDSTTNTDKNVESMIFAESAIVKERKSKKHVTRKTPRRAEKNRAAEAEVSKPDTTNKEQTDSAGPAMPPCMGSLFIFSDLWGYIYLDKEKIGRAPTKKRLDIPCGKYSLKIENPSGKAYQGHIQVKNAQDLDLRIRQSDFK